VSLTRYAHTLSYQQTVETFLSYTRPRMLHLHRLETVSRGEHDGTTLKGSSIGGPEPTYCAPVGIYTVYTIVYDKALLLISHAPVRSSNAATFPPSSFKLVYQRPYTSTTAAIEFSRDVTNVVL